MGEAVLGTTVQLDTSEMVYLKGLMKCYSMWVCINALKAALKCTYVSGEVHPSNLQIHVDYILLFLQDLYMYIYMYVVPNKRLSFSFSMILLMHQTYLIQLGQLDRKHAFFNMIPASVRWYIYLHKHIFCMTKEANQCYHCSCHL